MFGRRGAVAASPSANARSPSSSPSSSPLTPNATARGASETPDANEMSLDELVNRASNLLADALTSAEDDGIKFSKINRARRMIEGVRQRAKAGDEDALEALGALEELANDAVDKVANGGAFREVVETPRATTTVASGGLDLFSGLTLNETPPMAMNATMISPTVDASPKPTTPISPADLFGLNNASTPDSSWRREKPRIGYGRREAGAGLMDFEATMMAKAEVSIEDAPVFDEVEVGGDDAFEFAVATPSEEDESATPIVGDDRGDARVELRGLLKASDVRFKPAKLAYESAEARRVAATSKRLVSAKECTKLLETIEKFKLEQEGAIGKDDFEAAARLEESIEGARRAYSEMIAKLFAAENEFRDCLAEASEALKTWIALICSSMDEIQQFAETKRRQLDDAMSSQHEAQRAAAIAREARKNALMVAKDEAQTTCTSLEKDLVDISEKRAALDAPLSELRDEIASLRAELQAKENKLHEKEIERTQLLEEEGLLRQTIADAARRRDAATDDLQNFDETTEEVSSGAPEELKEVQDIATEAENATASLQETLHQRETDLSSKQNALNNLATFITAETSARARLDEAEKALERTRDEKRCVESARQRETDLSSRIAELERVKTAAVEEKRFIDAQQASTTIKELSAEIDIAKASASVDAVALDDAIARASAALDDAVLASATARLNRLRAESGDAATVAIDLLRMAHPKLDL